MNFGASYYPEHWDEKRMAYDIELMKEAGFNTVRMGEFAWTRMEPEEGVFDFRWLDQAIDTFSRNGIRTVLCTPTACPPKWLMDRYPDIYTRDEKGIKRGFGSRRHYCFNSRSFHEAVRRIVYAMACHYKNNQNIIAWQIDNELGGDKNLQCYCSNCTQAFRTWLRKKYGVINVLNREWGTVFWNQVYRSFEEVDPPGYTHTVKNPSAALDYKRFCSDAAIDFQSKSMKILRESNPDIGLTTNIFGVDAEIEYNKLCATHDFVAWDSYPNLTLEKVEPYEHAMGCDACRGYKNRSFWRMETQCGAPGGDILFQTPRPGDLRRWAFQAIARGAEGILFFPWRTSPNGAEQYWHGILNHDGIPRRLYNEVRELGRELLKLSSMAEVPVEKQKAAIVHTQQISWVFEIQPLMEEYRYYHHVADYYKAVFDNHYQIDMISPEVDFDGYQLLILPNFIFSNNEWSNKLREFVKNGGNIVMDFRCGVKDGNNKMMTRPLPGDYIDLLGIEVEEYGIILEESSIDIAGERYGGKGISWYDMVGLKGAKALASFKGDYFDGFPAITVNCFGMGKCYYIATKPDRKLLSDVIKGLFEDSGILPVLKAPQGIETVLKKNINGDILFIINHTEECKDVCLEGSFIDLLKGNRVEGVIKIDPRDVLVLK